MKNDDNDLVEDMKPKSMQEKANDINYKIDIMMGNKNAKLEEKPIIDTVNDLHAKVNNLMKIEKYSKTKKFKLKRMVRASIKKTLKGNKILAIILTSNRTIQTKVINTYNGYIVLDGVPRLLRDFYVFFYEKKYPAIIIPEWKLEPFGNKEYYEENKTGLDTVSAIKMIYAYAKAGENKGNKGFDMKAIVIFAIIGIVAFAILSGGFQ